MSSPVQQIKSRLGITDVVGSYIKLEKAGANYRACCPFHNEKTPSFFISPSRESFHCFGCGKGGDIFTFVQEIEGVEFVGALKILADKAGVELTQIDIAEKSRTERLYEIIDDAVQYFEDQLEKNLAALSYLNDRGLTQETIKKFRVGFAPDGWRNLYDHLKLKKISDEEMLAVGLAIKNQKPEARTLFYDRFRSRIMFPLADASGRVVGFSGRIFDKDDPAKYVNSPQTELYDKSRILFGYDKAKLSIRTQDCCILVEGQIDLVLSHQAGLSNTVAVSGTALTEHHLSFIKRLTNNLVMAFDGDPAGLSASRRTVNLALGMGVEVKGALLPSGQDPADLIKEDPEAWIKTIANAKNIIDFYLDALADQKLDKRTLNLKVVSDVLPYVALLPHALDQAHFVSRVALFLNSPEEPVWEELRKVKNDSAPFNRTSAETATVTKKAAGQSKAQMLERQIVGLFFITGDENITPRLDALIAQIGEERVVELLDAFKEEKNKLQLELELVFDASGNIDEILKDLIGQYRVENLKKELAELMQTIRRAEEEGDKERLEEYLKKCQTLTKELNSSKN